MATLGTFTTGQVLTAAELNAIGTWTTFTPSWTNLTVGNGTNTGRYCQINKLLFVKTNVTFGTTSTMGNTPTMTLPASLTMDTTAQELFGTCTLQDTGTATFSGIIYRSSTTQVQAFVGNSTGTYFAYSTITATVPFTWTNTDRFVLDFWVQLS